MPTESEKKIDERSVKDTTVRKERRLEKKSAGKLTRRTIRFESICVVSAGEVVPDVKQESTLVKSEPMDEPKEATPVKEEPMQVKNEQSTPVKAEVSPAPAAAKAGKECASGSPQQKDTIVKVGSSMSRRVQPLQALNPYNNQWTVKVRVVSKEPMRHIVTKKEQVEVPVFSMEAVDEDGTAIRITAWRDVAEKYYPLMEVDKVYYISRGALKAADRRYSNTGNLYEMTLNSTATVEECIDADASKMQKAYHFIPIDKLSAYNGLRTVVDVLGIATSVGPVGSIKRKSTMEELIRRDVTLLDKTGKTINLTLWGELATHEGAMLEKLEYPLLAVSGVRVSDYNGVSISTITKTTVQINPAEESHAEELKQWFAEEGKTLLVEGRTTEAGEGLSSRRASLSGAAGNAEYETLSDLRLEETPASKEKPHYHNIKLTVAAIKPDQPMWYLACPEPGVNNKVVEDNGRYWCEATQKHYDNFNRRYVVSMKALDSTGDGWLSVFDQQATEILGVTADELAQLRDKADGSYERKIKQACWKEYVVRLSVRIDEYQDILRKRCMVTRCTPVDFQAESKRLLGLIQKFST